MTRITLGIVLLSATTIITCAPAQAQNGTLTRSFVSSAGVDGNPCTITQPCATFAHAYTKLSANGIIAALDPGKYGPITITTGVTINGNGWAAVTGPANGNAITINAPSGNVILTGLEIDGAGAAFNGIVFNSADNLTVSNCNIENFAYSPGLGNSSGDGILIQPAGGVVSFVITNTTVSNNGGHGILYDPTVKTQADGAIDHVVAYNNQYGIGFYPQSLGLSLVATVSNSIISKNSNSGIFVLSVSPTVVKLSIDNVTAASNGTAIISNGPANILLSRSVIAGNNNGVANQSSSGGAIYTYGNNQIQLNVSDFPNGGLTSLTPQ